MSTDFVINAQIRTETGKGAARRMRHAEQVPAIIYGAGTDPVQLTLAHKDIAKQLENEAFYSHVLTVNVDGKEEKAVLKDLQRHPSKARILHLDLMRVSASEKITMQVPLHFVGENVAPGVKEGGGLVSHQMSNVEIRCLAKDLPEFLEVDMSSLELNESLHLSDIKLPDGVEIVALTHGADHDLPIANIHTAKGGGEETPAGEAAAEGEKPEGEGE